MAEIPVPPSLSAPTQENTTYVVPKGHFVLASPGVAQMDPRIWQDAGVWNPHRWIDEKGVASQALAEYTSGDKTDYGFGSVSKGTESPYQPFGAGRHRCIGESVSYFLAACVQYVSFWCADSFWCVFLGGWPQFAYVQLQTILGTFIRNLEMELDGPFPKTNYQVRILSRLD